MKRQSPSSLTKRLLLTPMVCGLIACGGGNNATQEIADEKSPDTVVDEPMTRVNAESMLQEYVTSNVVNIRVISTDQTGQILSEPVLTRDEAIDFSVPTAAEKVEMGLLTESEKQIGVIIFQPEGEAMTLTLPGEGLSLIDLLNLNIHINADIWDLEPRILAGGLGFTNIIGVPGFTGTDAYSEQVVKEAGGTWNTLTGCSDTDPPAGAFTSAQSTLNVLAVNGPPEVLYAGGMPIEFSWPILFSTVQGTDFLVTLNDFSQVYADIATMTPNYDYNERAVAVLFGQFGNRLELDDPDVLYPVRIEVVDDGTPLMMVAPDGSLQSAVGLYVNAPGSPYRTPGNGPKLTGAKLNVASGIGDEGPPGFTASTPNDGISLYGEEAEYRLRVYTTGGYTPDGVTGLKPTQYNHFFQVQVRTNAGELIPLLQSGTAYSIDDQRIEVVGLAELGAPGQVVDGNDCYIEDKDNQIDIILKGDLGAMRKVVGVRVPSEQPAGEHTAEGYWQFYNPGGPGNTPVPDTIYAQGSPDHVVPVTIAIDDPMMVTYIDLRMPDQ
jgi:hypothetical protein